MDLRKCINLGLLAASICLLAACTASAELWEPTTPEKPVVSKPADDMAVDFRAPTPEPTPTPVPGPVWDDSHRLNVTLTPPESGNFELPIYGATGYTTVKLGLWAEKPRPTPPPTPAPEPIPAPEDTPPLTDSDSLVVPTPPAETAPPSETVVPETLPEEMPVETAPTAETPPPDTETLPPPEAGDSLVAAPMAARAILLEAAPTPLPTSTPSPFSGAMAVLPPGSAFTILEESGSWWRVKSSAGTGWVNHTFCMINLPDVLPSLVYDATNSYNSRYTTSGRTLPGITGQSLYTGMVYNPRFDQEQYLMPVLYAMAKRIGQAQQNALAQGNSLKLYEGYRPYAVQKAVLTGVSKLAEQDPEVKAGVSAKPWGVQWFISTGYSNHQRGYAIDVSLVKVSEAQYVELDGHRYLQVEAYEEYVMPTPIHELSIAAATFTEPVPVYSTTAWKKATLAPGMNESALGLQRYCTQAGLTPLASEWWHFNDVAAYQQIQSNLGVGGFEIKTCVSVVP